MRKLVSTELFYWSVDRSNETKTNDEFLLDRKLRKCIRCKEGCAACENSPDACSACPPDYSLKDTSCAKASKKCETDEYYDFNDDL